MDCAICKIPMDKTLKRGVEIYICPQCRCVWMDKGKLDKIIERYLYETASNHQYFNNEYFENKDKYMSKKKKKNLIPSSK